MSRPSRPNTTLAPNQTIIWTLPVRQRLIALWAEGHSTAAIGRALGCSKNAVISRAGREPECAERASPIKPITATDEQILAELRLGRSANEISKLLHVCAGRIRKVRDEHGLPGGRNTEVEMPLIRSVQQNTFELIVIPRPVPVPVLPRWVSMPIPPAKVCQWVEETGRKHQWRHCEEPVVARGNPYCACHAERAFVRQEQAA